MSRSKDFTMEQVKEAIKNSQGMYSLIGKHLGGCHRDTAKKYVLKWEETRKAYEDEIEIVGDLAESELIKAIKRGEAWAIKFYLAMKGQSRGYVSQPVIKIDNDEPLNINFAGISKKEIEESGVVEIHEDEDASN